MPPVEPLAHMAFLYSLEGAFFPPPTPTLER